MRHLNPIRSTDSVSGGSHGVNTGQNTAGNSNLQQLALLAQQAQMQIGNMRALEFSTQEQIANKNSEVSSLSETNNEEMTYTKSFKEQIADFLEQSDKASFDAIILKLQAKALRSAAADRSDSAALIQIAKQKELKAEELQKESQVAKNNAKGAEFQADSHSSNQESAEAKLESTKGEINTLESNSLNYSNQISNLSSTANASGMGGAISSPFNNAGFNTTSFDGAGGSAASGSGGAAGSGGAFGPLGNNIANGSASSTLLTAESLLDVIVKLRSTTEFPNPSEELAINSTRKELGEQAGALLELAASESVLQGIPGNERIILRKSQAHSIVGEATTNITYWKDLLRFLTEASAKTHDVAKKVG